MSDDHLAGAIPLTDNSDRLGADVDLDQTRVDGLASARETPKTRHRPAYLVELTESTDETDGTLVDFLERVGARAARDHADGANEGSKAVHHGSVEAVLP